ncbi:GTPase NRas-like [Antechinus flavipes]|uniref:GTPase NRas-like n=1 Tax=Antechinus flavipes TaxID=38775 RepID=UPI002235DEEE|nr:GTPase NRas-like [Antechinus flavipes]
MVYKLVVMGSCGVGKSALIVRLVKNCFVTDHNLNIEDFYPQIVVDGKPCQLQIFDTAGNEETPHRFRDFLLWGDGFLCVYAVDDIKSFVDVNIFRDQLIRVKNTEHIPFVLVANKADVANCLVSPVLGQAMAKDFQVPFVEVSAKTGQSVEYAFQELVREIHRMWAEELGHLPIDEQNQGCGFKYCMIM